MELFKLLGTITIDNSKANKALDETSEKGEQAESKLGKAFGKIGTGVAKFGKTVGIGMLAAGTAVAGLVTQSTQSYAEYEQLVGGVETLFKDSAGKVMEYANNAFQTAGMSANEYMTTVTSFSASLLQSLGGDTNAAADKANMAITDMSDNANKMGTSMEMIQNAYQGFAKQNYTMLDNLKLGYGGTKEEMARLLADAEKISGQKFDLSSYGDVVDAIHVIQTEMGITGTTAAEASGTITGSAASIKASWANLLTALADDNADLGSYVNTFVNSLTTATENFLPRIGIALEGVVQLVDQLAPVIIEKIPGLLGQLLPGVITAATGLIMSLVSILPSLIDLITGTLLPSANSAIQSIFTALVTALPQLIGTLASALPTLIPLLIDTLVAMILVLCTNLPLIIQPLIDNLPMIIESLLGGLLSALPQLVQGLIGLAVALIPMIPQILNILLDTILVTYPTMMTTMLMELIPVILVGIVQLVWAIIKALPELLLALGKALVTMLGGQLLVVIATLFEPLLPWLEELWNAIVSGVQTAWDWISGILSAVGTWIYDNVIAPVAEYYIGLWKGIVEAYHTVIDPWIEIFTRIAAIVDEKVIQPMKKYFADLWNAVSVGLQAAWGLMTGIFSTISGWVNENVVQPVMGLFSKIWNKLKSGAQDAWTGIKETFGKVASFFGDIFGKAWEKVKGVFSVGGKIFDGIKDGILSAFKNVVNTIIRGINRVVKVPFDGLNKILNRISGIEIVGVKPFDWLTWRAPIPAIPELAQGGVLRKGQQGFLEGDGDEAVVPLSKNTEWMRKVAENIHGFMIDSASANASGVHGYTGTSADRMASAHMQSEVAALRNTLDSILDRLDVYMPDVLEHMERPVPAVVGVDQAADALFAPLNYRFGRSATQKGRGR